jgi:N-acetyl-gamma-glutamyl-phosphate reductase
MVRQACLNEADIAFLCLPDAASREAVSLVTNENTKIIDASTAYRTDPEWAYGIPELSNAHRENIKKSKRVSVPGCHASGFQLALFPLIKEGIVSKDYPVNCYSLTGYSGGGKKLIDMYENTDKDRESLKSPNMYSLGLNHKHLPEMQTISGLTNPPLFTPILGNIYKGMLVVIPLFRSLLNKPMNAEDIQEFMAAYYKGQHFIDVKPFGIDKNSHLFNNYLDCIGCKDTNKNEIYIFGNEEQILLVSRLDNLGKGSSGAAVQNMNIMLGLEEWAGLE